MRCTARNHKSRQICLLLFTNTSYKFRGSIPQYDSCSCTSLELALTYQGLSIGCQCSDGSILQGDRSYPSLRCNIENVKGKIGVSQPKGRRFDHGGVQSLVYQGKYGPLPNLRSLFRWATKRRSEEHLVRTSTHCREGSTRCSFLGLFLHHSFSATYVVAVGCCGM